MSSPAARGSDATEGHIVTFYAHKGGVGRSMALANVARLLQTRHSLRVVCVDLDLEAPGLHYYFGLTDAELSDQAGVLDFLDTARAAIHAGRVEALPHIDGSLLSVSTPEEAPEAPPLRLLTSGKRDASYYQRASEFDWRRLYAEEQGFRLIELLKRQLRAQADVVLIDSPTGDTMVAGMATVQMADLVMFLFPTNRAGISSLAGFARALAHPEHPDRKGMDPLTVVPVLARVHTDESTLLEAWKQEILAPVIRELVEADLLLPEYLETGNEPLQLPEEARWAYGERADIGIKRTHGLGATYRLLAENLVLYRQGEAWRSGRAPGLEEQLAQELEAASRRDDRPLLALLNYASAVQAAERNEHTAARALSRTSLLLSRQLEHLEGVYSNLILLGTQLAETTAERVSRLSEALKVAVQASDRRAQVKALELLAAAQHDAGAEDEVARLESRAAELRTRSSSLS